ncbi:MAG TPA: prepilin-type N-terminal cleavage/methylation domain-containing protein [Patescibacteria group bacterium]|nr:prepilin-type N-terminal cleavage/methylation domain-containing protein [Patescibacteria group bacterium]
MGDLYKRTARGFTLIELLVVMGIIIVLVAIVLVAVSPGRQFSQANNTKRRSDVVAILNAVQQYVVDNHGVLPAGITASAKTIEKAGGIDLCASLVTTYLAALPVDPLTNSGTLVSDCTSSYNTNYTILKSAADSRITVAAPAAELSATISATQ